MLDRELFTLMWQAASRATDAAIAAGHRRDSQVTKDSAWAAAHGVYLRERPDEAPTSRFGTTEDTQRERMEREPTSSP